MFGVLGDQKVGKVAIMSMKSLSIILVHCKLKNALPMIHMLEGMLVVSDFHLVYTSLKITKVSLYSKISYH